MDRTVHNTVVAKGEKEKKKKEEEGMEHE